MDGMVLALPTVSPAGSDRTRSDRTQDGGGDAPDGDDALGDGIVDMHDLLHPPPEAFEVIDQHWYMGEWDATGADFYFTRRVKATVILGLGGLAGLKSKRKAGKGKSKQQDPLHTESVYTKTPDDHATVLFLALMIGVGLLDVSRAVAKCGYLLGLSAIVGLGSLQYFLCLRITEVPNFFGTDLESYGDIAKVAFSPSVHRFIVFMIVCNWFGRCSLHMTQILQAIDTLFCQENKCVGWRVKLLSGVALAPLAFTTNAKALRQASVIALGAMLALASVEMALAANYGVERWNDAGRHVLEPDSWWSVFEGLHYLLLPCSGAATIPYLVAEMQFPNHARKIISTAWTVNISLCLAVGAICYFGWGNDILRKNPIQELYALGQVQPMYYYAGVSMYSLLMVKTVVSFPLYFWPLCREIESFMSIEESPEVKLLLPWAIRNLVHWKRAMRIFLLGLTFLPMFFSDYRPFKKFTVAVPLNMVEYMLPAIFSVYAIHHHQQDKRRTRSATTASARSRQASTRSRTDTVGSAAQANAESEMVGRRIGAMRRNTHLYRKTIRVEAPPEWYLMQDPGKHLVVTVVVAILVCSMSICIFIRWLKPYEIEWRTLLTT